MSIVDCTWPTLFCFPKWDSLLTNVTNLVINLPNFKKKHNKFKKAIEVKTIEKRDSEGQLTRLIGIIGAQLRLANALMVQKDH